MHEPISLYLYMYVLILPSYTNPNAPPLLALHHTFTLTPQPKRLKRWRVSVDRRLCVHWPETDLPTLASFLCPPPWRHFWLEGGSGRHQALLRRTFVLCRRGSVRMIQVKRRLWRKEMGVLPLTREDDSWEMEEGGGGRGSPYEWEIGIDIYVALLI